MSDDFDLMLKKAKESLDYITKYCLGCKDYSHRNSNGIFGSVKLRYDGTCSVCWKPKYIEKVSLWQRLNKTKVLKFVFMVWRGL